ncbi:MAG: class I SAM-dependent methyltransferase [Candidatus Methanofastidiosia archaeon]|jgi:ubiquinone/menaquinone biosynthesis C-methylase UbiE
MEYTDVAAVWDAVFAQKKPVNPENPLPPGIEEGVEWLVNTCVSIIDFGCGRGSIVLRCAVLGANSVVGIDISLEGINIAEHAVAEYNVPGAVFICGELSELSKFKENEFDGGILSNIVDNVHPEDAAILLEEYHRILNFSGRVFLTLNPYFPAEVLEKWNVEEIAENFYKEESGLYFWNVSDDEMTDVLSDYFSIVKKAEVELPEHEQVNRVYYLENKK